MHYSEVTPVSPLLRRHIRCFWFLRDAPAELSPERVLPDGCCEIVINRAARFRQQVGDRWELQARHLLVGQIRRFLMLAPTGEIDLVGIRFEPGGLARFVPAPAGELIEQRIDLDAVDRNLRIELEAAGDEIDAIESVLLKRLRRTRTPELPLAVERLVESRGAMSIDELNTLFGGARRLERAFRRDVGMPAKTLARVVRFQQAVRALDTGGQGGAQLALACGYFDQAHLIRDFRAFAGQSPTGYLADQHAMSDAFVSDLSNSGT
ncbi:MAG: helix-turn-helix domain-containing protein [Planctomycetota bacterium]